MSAYSMTLVFSKQGKGHTGGVWNRTFLHDMEGKTEA